MSFQHEEIFKYVDHEKIKEINKQNVEKDRIYPYKLGKCSIKKIYMKCVGKLENLQEE